MPKLWELAKLVRAKNAGPFTLTARAWWARGVSP